MSQFVNYSLTLGQQKAPEIGYASLGLSLEQYGVNEVKTQVPGAVALTSAEQGAYQCGDLTPAEVQAGQTSPTCGVTNPHRGPARRPHLGGHPRRRDLCVHQGKEHVVVEQGRHGRRGHLGRRRRRGHPGVAESPHHGGRRAHRASPFSDRLVRSGSGSPAGAAASGGRRTHHEGAGAAARERDACSWCAVGLGVVAAFTVCVVVAPAQGG